MMRLSSKILLLICAVLFVFLAGVYFPLVRESKPEMTEQDARIMLARLATAFEQGKTSQVLSFAFPDAEVAGRNLDRVRALLQQAFRNMQNPHVELRDVRYDRKGAMATVNAHVTVTDHAGGGSGETVYDQPMEFVVKRRAVPHLLGLMTTYEWKITDVDAPRLPEEATALGF